MMKNAVIFDVDGTLVDSVDLHARAWSEAFHQFGYDVTPAQARTQIGKGGDELLPVFLPPADLARIGDALKEWRGQHFRDNYLGEVRGFPGVRTLFEALLAQGTRIGLGTSAQSAELTELKQAAGIADLDLGEVSSKDANRSKPHPDIFQVALQRLDATPAETIVVGDSPYDAEAASKAGMQSIGLLCGGFPKDDLDRAGFIALFRDPADLLQNLRSTQLVRPPKP